MTKEEVQKSANAISSAMSLWNIEEGSEYHKQLIEAFDSYSESEEFKRSVLDRKILMLEPLDKSDHIL